MSGGGTIGTSDIDFLDIKTAFNNVNGTTSTTDIDLSLFRGCVVTGGSGYSNVTTAGTYTVLSSTTPSYSYTVPSGITSIEVEMWGGDGGSGGRFSSVYTSTGGKGGYFKGTLTVSEGNVINVYSGARGHSWGTVPDGYNGVVRYPPYTATGTGGWGGGVGKGNGGTCNRYGMSGGGGATSLYVNNSLKIIVGGAGGGGNARYATSQKSNGGAGGGGSLNTSIGYGQTMASSTQFYNRGAGGGGQHTAGNNSGWGGWSSTMDGRPDNNNIQGGGGGGYYGGGTGNNSTGGGGGSGWISASVVSITNAYRGDSASRPANPTTTNPLTGDVDGLQHGCCILTVGSIITYSIPTTGPLTISSNFSGKTFTYMRPEISMTVVGSSGSTLSSGSQNADTYLTITFVITQPTSDFTIDDITVTNGVKSNFQSVSATNYTVVFTPNNLTNGTVHTIVVNSGVFKNNITTIDITNVASSTFSWTYQVPIGIDVTTSFYSIGSSVKYITSNDYSGAWDVSETQVDASGNHRIILALRVTTATTYYNDICIAGVQRLSSTGTVLNTWVFNTSSGGTLGSQWTTSTSASSTLGTPGNLPIPATTTIYVGGSRDKMTWATATSSSYTGVVDGIYNSYTNTAFPTGLGKISQSNSTYYAYREVSGSTRWTYTFFRGPVVSFNTGDIIKVAHLITTASSQSSSISLSTSLHLGVY